LASYSELLDAEDIVTKIFPCIKPLATDAAQHVRSALAGSLLKLCPIIGKKNTNDLLLSNFLLLLRDESSEVRINLFNNLDEIAKVIDVESLS